MKNSEKKQSLLLKKIGFFLILAVNLLLTAAHVYAIVRVLNSDSYQEETPAVPEETEVQAAEPAEESPPSGPARLYLNSNPSGAKIFINGYYKGKTSAEIEVNPETGPVDYTITLIYPGYNKAEAKVTLSPGESYNNTFDLAAQ